MMALGGRGGGGADELLSFLERGMIQHRGVGGGGGGGEGWSWTGAEREICAFFSFAAQEIAGHGEKGRERKREKGQVKYFPLWQRKWGKVERASSILRNGLNHPQRGCWKSQLHRPLSKCTYMWWMILTFTSSAFSSLLSRAQGAHAIRAHACPHNLLTACQAILALPPWHSQGVENISPETIDSSPQLSAPSAALSPVAATAINSVPHRFLLRAGPRD